VLRDSQQFYSTAFDNLLNVVSIYVGILGILVAIFGVLAPLLLGYLQNARSKVQSKEIEVQRKEIEGQRKSIVDLEDRLMTGFRGEVQSMENRVREISEELNERFDSLESKANMELGNLWLDKGVQSDSASDKLFSFSFALSKYAQARYRKGIDNAIKFLLGMNLFDAGKSDVEMFLGPRKSLDELIRRTLAGDAETIGRWETLLKRMDEVIASS
jgi:hypothetical protein